MESIYFVVSWLCHRTCVHCYEERFHPYYGEERERILEGLRQTIPRIIENLPARMVYRDLQQRDLPEQRGRIILAGGEVLLEGVREKVLYPALEQIQAKYRGQGGVEIIVQTTGDLVTAPIVRELLEHHTTLISVAGLDAYHRGLEDQEERDALQAKLTGIFDVLGMKPWTPPPRSESDRYYHFFGATPDQWIGKLWPRGRAWRNGLSTADITENFCNRWSGGLNFLQQGFSGSEVSVDPDGNVYPCCLKTKKPVGNLLERPLEDILRSLEGNPVYEAISMGRPERMGIQYGWSVETFLEKSKVAPASGGTYQNLCIGCDRFHEEVLLAPGLVTIGG
ncbi:MAG: SPASM domain-containing protein [Bryobacterales bacterium]|nr:SPASM domain-containing protein [Bryobacterales bacterium]